MYRGFFCFPNAQKEIYAKSFYILKGWPNLLASTSGRSPINVRNEIGDAEGKAPLPFSR